MGSPDSLRSSFVGLRLLHLRLKEWLEFDSILCRTVADVVGFVVGFLLYACWRTREGFAILAKLHRSAYSRWSSAAVTRLVRRAIRRAGSCRVGGEAKAKRRAAPGRRHRLIRTWDRYVERLSPEPHTIRFFQEPRRLLGSLAIVLKSPGPAERGVVLMNYSHIFPLFARLFDVEQVARKYHIVLEPSWSGYCTPEVLCYARYDFPIFAEAYEPRDAEFLRQLDANLVPVPTSTNWWVDHRLFRPRPEVHKDADVIMVASWAAFKRHYRLFAALRALRKQGHALRVILLGYPCGMTRDDIGLQAKYYGVHDQLEVREGVPHEEVAIHLNRARVNMIWSRKEGVNRAIIEGMFAGIPCLVRQGFNYGHPYAYINSQTGCFASEADLPEKLLWMVENHHQFSPRDYVLATMSPQRATDILAGVIQQSAQRMGERWTDGLAVKVNRLHDMTYWDEQDRERFREDYAFLLSTVRA